MRLRGIDAPYGGANNERRWWITGDTTAADEVVALTPLTLYAREGRMWYAGPRLDIGNALTIDIPVVRLANPSGSGRTIMVWELAIYTNVTQWFRLQRNLTLDAPTVAGGPFAISPHDDVGAAGLVEFDTGAPTGADWRDSQMKATADYPLTVTMPGFEIAAGESIVIAGDNPSAQQTQVTFWWTEDDA
jgi:hypothetical protein